MKKLWNCRFYILSIIGLIVMFLNCNNTWNNNFKFALMLLGMVIAFIAVCLQLIIAPDIYNKHQDNDD